MPRTVFIALAWLGITPLVIDAFGQSPRQRDGRPVPRNVILEALDTDGDGRLSAEEIAHAAGALKRLDRNGDGRLSREELRAQPTSGPRRSGRPEPERAAQNGRPANPAPEGQAPAIVSRAVPGPLPGFMRIPSGQFDMGDHHDLGGGEHSNDEVPIHRVRLDSFAIAVTETTNTQYARFLNAALADGSVEIHQGLVFSPGRRFLYCDTRSSDEASSIDLEDGKFVIVDHRAEHPVVCIRWYGAAAYCNWLSREKSCPACYDPSSWQCDYTKQGFRLPTEAEWEYAGRGGLCGPYYIFPWGNDPNTAKANWPQSGDPYETGPYPWTTPVGFYNGQLRRKTDFHWPGSQETYQTADGVNGYGLYDMAGNVWEWTGDWYDHDYYGVSPAANPRGPERGQPMRDGKPYRSLRGGSWYNGQWGHSRVSNRNPSYYRGPDDPNHRWYHIGFRVVLAVAEESKGEIR